MNADSKCPWCSRTLREHGAAPCNRAGLSIQRDVWGKFGSQRLVWGHEAGFYRVDPRSFPTYNDAAAAARQTFGFDVGALPRA